MKNVHICPTIMTDDPSVFQKQMEEAAQYASRVHIDLGDGVFAKRFVEVENIWWPGGVRADLHVMYQRPFEHVEAMLALGPQLVIVHAEAEGDFVEFATRLRAHGIESGVCLLQETPVEAILPALQHIDHVLIFSGILGQRGVADLGLLAKVRALRSHKPQLEIGWDGGVNDTNARALAEGGVDVLNAGGYLHGDNPAEAYTRIKTLLTH
ncbi:hypothetical protein KBC77_01615 [Candidatus Saccharibacteria bacterium]|nr:hypothetical protein [Candidatus Saccharibacteria bacterium]